MKGPNAFCPESGAALSERRHYVEDRPQHHSTSGDVAHGGLLTNGKLVSSRTALLRYFADCHGEHGDVDDDLYRAAAVALVRLKRTEGKHLDVWVWVALQERLVRRGFDVDWMAGHATPRCPRCAGRLRWERDSGGDLRPRCIGSCDRDPGLLDAMRGRVLAVYNRAFDPIEALTVA